MITELRIVLWTIAAFLLGGGLLLLLCREMTQIYWAWTIGDPLTAMMVGTGLLAAGVYVLQLLLRASRSQIQDRITGLVVFCGLMLIATMNHWDEFRQYHPVTFLWLIVCFTGPVTIPVLVHRQQSAGEQSFDAQPSYPGMLRLWIMGRGFVYASIAVLWLFNAGSVSTFWPWSISGINLQVFTMQPLLAGWIAVPLLRDRRTGPDHRFLLILGATLGLMQIALIILFRDMYDWKSMLGILIPLMYLEWIVTPITAFVSLGKSTFRTIGE